VGGRKGIWPVKKWRDGGGHKALVSPDGVAPNRMVGVSASVNLPLHHKVQKFSAGTGSPGWSRKNGCKTIVCIHCCTTVFCICVHVHAEGHHVIAVTVRRKTVMTWMLIMSTQLMILTR